MHFIDSKSTFKKLKSRRRFWMDVSRQLFVFVLDVVVIVDFFLTIQKLSILIAY